MEKILAFVCPHIQVHKAPLLLALQDVTYNIDTNEGNSIVGSISFVCVTSTSQLPPPRKTTAMSHYDLYVAVVAHFVSPVSTW